MADSYGLRSFFPMLTVPFKVTRARSSTSGASENSTSNLVLIILRSISRKDLLEDCEDATLVALEAGIGET